MARLVVLFLLPFVLAGEMSITGYVKPPCKEGETCPDREPMTGHVLDVWNCNGKCTKVRMECGIDKFRVVVETDKSSKVFVYALGGNGNQAFNASQGLCEATGVRQMTDLADGRTDPRPLFTYADIDYDKCGTLPVDDVNNPLNANNRIFKNELDIVEFLQVQNGAGGRLPIYQVSHTRVKLECCYTPEEVTDECDPPQEPTSASLTDCDQNDFSLSCNSYADSESFCCDVKLSEKFHTDDIGWVLDSCEGVDINGNQDTVVLFQNGNGATSNLGVVNNIIGEGETRQHSVSGPWFQFDRDPSDLEPHTVGVRCTVRLIGKDEWKPYQATAISGCPASGRRDAGFFQAGQLTLVK